jgi:penicillin-binding protein 1C
MILRAIRPVVRYLHAHNTWESPLAVAIRSIPWRVSAAWFLLFALTALGSARLPSPLEPVEKFPSSTWIADRSGGPLSGTLSDADEWRLPIPLSEMGPYLPSFAVAVEDRRFWGHPGIDLLALVRATGQNLRAGRTVSGGSTLTSQVVRLSFPRSRTWTGKVAEFLDALTLDRVRPKSWILEQWFNLIPGGGNLRGVEAASLGYFGKRAKDLSPAEAALLVGLARAPSELRPDRNPEGARKLRDRILDRLVAGETLSEEAALRARAEPIPPRRAELPERGRFIAPHVLKELAGTDRSGRIKTGIDPSLQEVLEGILGKSLASLPPSITAAAILVEVRTGAVRAYVGNARYRDGGEGAWVDCGNAPRSPGSLLKPFVYGLAFDQGKLDPGSLLADTPLGLGGGAPRNFDPTYRGPVSARIALADSLNVPAVRVLRLVGGNAVLDLFRSLGLRHMDRDARHYGDSLVLGGCEVTLLEAARAYLALARLGEPAELTWTAPQQYPPYTSTRRSSAPPAEARLLSPGAAYLVTDILQDTRRLLPAQRERRETEGNVAFKTGTSYALRDAWTGAYTPSHLALVWFGDPTGASHPELVGLHLAAPAALALMSRLGPATDFLRPDEVEERRVCALSGNLPGAACMATRRELALREISPNEICTLHQFVDGHPQVVWPRDLAPLADPQRSREGGPLLLIPREGTRYVLAQGSPSRLTLRWEGGIGALAWFLDGRHLPQGGTPSIPLLPGPHRLSVCDEKGNVDTVRFHVEPSDSRKSGRAPEEDTPELNPLLP